MFGILHHTGGYPTYLLKCLGWVPKPLHLERFGWISKPPTARRRSFVEHSILHSGAATCTPSQTLDTTVFILTFHIFSSERVSCSHSLVHIDRRNLIEPSQVQLYGLG